MTSARLRELVPEVMLHESRLFLRLALPAGSPACPFAGFTFLTASPPHSNDRLWCRTITPAFHRLRLQRPRLRSRLTLGRLTLPRNPQACGVGGSHTHLATHSGIRSSVRSTSPCDLASPLTERSPTIPTADSSCEQSADIHSFGTMLEPRYVVGAHALDQ